MADRKERHAPPLEKLQPTVTPDAHHPSQLTKEVAPTPPPTPTASPRIISFEDCPKANPYKWPTTKKLYVVCFTLLSVTNSGIASSLPSNVSPQIMEAFNMEVNSQSSLPTGIFLIGYVVGPLIWSPLSETIGRRPVLLYTFIGFFLFTLATALAPSWSSLLFFRFVCGCMGAAPQTVIGGAYADIFEAKSRGRAMAFYMSVASFGPIIGPIISGFASVLNWRWTFWIDLIFAGFTLAGLIFLPESFGPVILKREAAKMSKLSGQEVIAPVSKLDTDLTTIFIRPLYMLVFEPIILFSSLYVGVVYALVFFFFQAYPIIFPEVYGFSIQMTSLAILPLGIGASSTVFAALYWDSKYNSALACKQTWVLPFSPELHRLPIACLGGVLIVISLFWLAWTATPSIHWIAPVLSGAVFGFGYQSIFTCQLIYVTDAYKIYSASALASSVILRSIMGAALPVAAKPMYASLGVGWATSLIGFVSLACVPIPYILLWKGQWIRERSRFCQMLVKENWSSSESGSVREAVQDGGVRRQEC
ncbi:major facilitator superfamily domain-containing protein [Aspergillus karnatakaensis]|uniref:putative MFS multidrug transporter n=1 Tax=Aspergillus karnatakaensis TaxID=1810916 RepID=UPI003CCDC3E4